MTKAPASVLAGAFVVLALAGCGSTSATGDDEAGGTSSSATSPGTAAGPSTGDPSIGDPSTDDPSTDDPATDRPIGSPAEGSVADGLTAETNRVRTAEGLPTLEPSPCLDAQARERAAAQARERASAQTPPPLEHAPLGPVTQECGADRRAAENLVDFPAGTDVARVLEAWMQSPGHRNNLVDPGLQQVGTGCVASAKGTLCSQLYLGPQ